MCQKPTNLDEYTKWLAKNHKTEIDRKTSNHFDSLALKVKDTFENSNYWSEIRKNMRDFNEEYLLQTGYPLFIDPNNTPKLLVKSFSSFFLKTFRINVLQNENWPEPPSGGWVLTDNWIIRSNDIVRTCFVVKYLDGVEFLKNKLITLADQLKQKSSKYYVAGTDGYYAAHVYVADMFEVPCKDYDTEKINISIELQITSQLQEVIRKLLHQHFESRRKKTSIPDVEWQWDYKSDEFATNYLGHILHYVEGMIMEVRDRDDKKKKGAVK